MTPQNLPIEKKTNYYLIQNLECREVVKARNTTIDSLKAISADKNKAIEVSKLEAGASRRVVSALQDSLVSTDRNFRTVQEQFYTERKRKKAWRKFSGILGMLCIAEGGFLYILLK